MSQLITSLTKLFDTKRIVFWYDANLELREEFDEVQLAEVEKLVIENNEFWLKHHVLREKPSQKFLLYHAGPKPRDEDNWLLDVVLAYGEFRADQVSLWLAELGLKAEDWDFVQSHEPFFKKEKNRVQFHDLWTGNQENGVNKESIILSVCLESNTVLTLEVILTKLLDEAANGELVYYQRIQEVGLADYVWSLTNRAFGYQSGQPSVKDFAISLFKACYALEMNQPAEMKADALVFMQRWKDSLQYHDSFENFSEQSEQVLGITKDLQQRSLTELIEMDLFEVVDRHIIKQLINQVNNRTISGGDANNLVWRRRKSPWFKTYQHLYQTIQYAAQFFSLLGQTQLEIQDPYSGVALYTQRWYPLDRLYRKVIFHARESGQTTLLQSLLDQVESQYSSRFVLVVNDNWQQVVNALPKWQISGIRNQTEFYEHWVKPFVLQKTRLVVIISDALRYEVASELAEIIEGQKGYETNLETMLGVLPSYTQLGMAALLPHKTLTMTGDASVLVDGLPSAGLDNRVKILRAAHDQKATAVKAEELMGMNREALRELLRDHPLVYVYHNHIDAVGDKRESEHLVFDAVEKTNQELLTMTKKLANAAVSHILITADHGFLYQDRVLEESDFAGQDIRSDVVSYKNRRFALGHQMMENNSATKYQTNQVGLKGDIEIHIPKSINRFRLQGAGSRFVHGGSSLQEVIIPVLKVHKAEGRETPQVNVEIIRGTTNTITSGQISVTFYQKEAVSGSRLPRVLRAGLYASDKTLISDEHTLTFDLTSETDQERQVKVRFILNQKAESYNNQEVEIRLEEQAAGTSHYSLYKSTTYQLKKSFADFDF